MAWCLRSRSTARKVLTFVLVAVTWLSGMAGAHAAMGALPCHGMTHHEAAGYGDHHDHGHAAPAEAPPLPGLPDYRDDFTPWRSLCCSVHCLTSALVTELAPVLVGFRAGAVLPADTRRSGVNPPPLDRPPIT